MHQSVRKNVMRVLLVVGLVISSIGVGVTVKADDSSHIYYFKGNHYGLDYGIRTKKMYQNNKKPSQLNNGDLELVFSSQISPFMMDIFNQKNSDQKYPEFPSLYGNITFANNLNYYIDTIRFEKAGYPEYLKEKIKMPKNISSFFYKNPDLKYIEGLNNIDISNSEQFDFLFDGSNCKNIDISSWNLRNKNVGDLGIYVSQHDSITLGTNTIFSGGNFADNLQAEGKMINQETGFCYNAKTFLHDYDGSQPGTYKFMPK